MFKLIKSILGLYLLCLVGKLAISLFDGKVTQYSLQDLSVDGIYFPASWDGKSPKLSNKRQTDYRLIDNYIVSNTSGHLREIRSPDCVIMDLRNWDCTWQENGYRRGQTFNKFTFNETMKNGEYYIFASGWSFDELISENKYADVSFLHYHINGCRWDFYEGLVNGLIVCPLRFIIG